MARRRSIAGPVIQKLRDSARDQSCVRCGANDGTCVLAHYFGPRRHAYGGGMGHKGWDCVGAILCSQCHLFLDQGSRDKEDKWIGSEEFLHCCALTWIRWFVIGAVITN